MPLFTKLDAYLSFLRSKVKDKEYTGDFAKLFDSMYDGLSFREISDILSLCVNAAWSGDTKNTFYKKFVAQFPTLQPDQILSMLLTGGTGILAIIMPVSFDFISIVKQWAKKDKKGFKRELRITAFNDLQVREMLALRSKAISRLLVENVYVNIPGYAVDNIAKFAIEKEDKKLVLAILNRYRNELLFSYYLKQYEESSVIEGEDLKIFCRLAQYADRIEEVFKILLKINMLLPALHMAVNKNLSPSDIEKLYINLPELEKKQKENDDKLISIRPKIEKLLLKNKKAPKYLKENPKVKPVEIKDTAETDEIVEAMKGKINVALIKTEPTVFKNKLQYFFQYNLNKAALDGFYEQIGAKDEKFDAFIDSYETQPTSKKGDLTMAGIGFIIIDQNRMFITNAENYISKLVRKINKDLSQKVGVVLYKAFLKFITVAQKKYGIKKIYMPSLDIRRLLFDDQKPNRYRYSWIPKQIGFTLTTIGEENLQPVFFDRTRKMRNFKALSEETPVWVLNVGGNK